MHSFTNPLTYYCSIGFEALPSMDDRFLHSYLLNAFQDPSSQVSSLAISTRMCRRKVRAILEKRGTRKGTGPGKGTLFKTFKYYVKKLFHA